MSHTAVLLISLASQALASDGQQFISFRPDTGVQMPASSSTTFEIGIDDSVEVEVDEVAVFAAVSSRRKIVATTPPLAPRLQFLEATAVGMLRAHELQMAVRFAIAAATAAKGTPAEAGANIALSSANAALATFALPFFEELDSALDKDMELKAALDSAVQEAIQKDNYSEMAVVIRRFLLEAGTDLGERAGGGSKLHVTMTGRISDGTSRGAPIHLEGYDDIKTGSPVPFERFQLAVDERTQMELLAADKLSKSVDAVLSGSYQRKFKSSVQGVEAAVRSLHADIRSEVIIPELEAAIGALHAARSRDLQPLVRDLISLRALFLDLKDQPVLDDVNSTESLLFVSRRIEERAKWTITALSGAPSVIQSAIRGLEQVARDRPGLIEGRLQRTLAKASQALVESLEPIRLCLVQLQELAGAVGFTAELGQTSDEILRRPRELGYGVSLDSRFDLETIKDWRRRPGDRVAIVFKVEPGDDSSDAQSLVSVRQKFQLETYGTYLSTRGGLLFVDSRSGSGSKQSFETAPGVAFHLRYGIRNRPWFSRGFAPGIGFSLALLDFDDNKNLELGLAGSATFIRDIFWVGYGRNLQAQANYFFIGINPIALGGVMNLQGR